MTTPVGHLIFYIALFIIVMIAIYALIQVTVTQVAFWILRPSEMFAMDLVGATTALGGTTGEVETCFWIYTANVTYYVDNPEKILCVISQRKQDIETPVIGVLTTFNCFSTPFTPQFNFDPDEEFKSYRFELKKWFDPSQNPPIIVTKGDKC